MDHFLDQYKDGVGAWRVNEKQVLEACNMSHS